jgi:hypothetical protein
MTNETENSRRILELLAQGKITVDEADQLLRAVTASDREGPSSARSERTGTSSARWLRITVDKAARDGRPPKQVSVRVPMSLVRSGVRLGAIFPRLAADPVSKHLRDQGIDVDFSKIDLSQLDTMLGSLGETTIDVDEGRAQVRIACE